MLADLARAFLGAIAAGVLPGYFWAGFLRPAGGLGERLAWSSALSLASVPVLALVLARGLGIGVTLWVAIVSIAVVLGSGGLALALRGAPAGPASPVLPRPPAIRDVRALALLVAAFGLVLAVALGLPSPWWLLIVILALLAAAGVLAAAGTEPGWQPPEVLREPGLALVLALTAVRAYAGPIRHDWPYLRGSDQFSHAVMAQQMLAHGSYTTYLIYPPGFSTLTAVICRVSGLTPLALFPVLAPALLVLTTAAAYALATRLWGWEYGLVAAALSGLVLRGPYASFAEGRYPDLTAAYFLLVMLVAALITLYGSATVRSAVLVAVIGGSGHLVPLVAAPLRQRDSPAIANRVRGEPVLGLVALQRSLQHLSPLPRQFPLARSEAVVQREKEFHKAGRKIARRIEPARRAVEWVNQLVGFRRGDCSWPHIRASLKVEFRF